tara:strand:+ start:1173 stop:2153 length:981 start_codon:yes stop_codon:yes gene_type:complete
MGHSVTKSILANKLNQAMGIYLPALNTRGQRRGWESAVIGAYGKMINNLNSMMSSVGFGTLSEVEAYNDPVSKKKTHDALAGALGGFENITVSQLQADISHDMNELIRLETIKGGENIHDPLTQYTDLIEPDIVSELTDKISQKTNYLNSYNGAGVFLDISGLVNKQKKTLELRKSIEMEKNRILYEDERSEEAQQLAVDVIATNSITDYQASVTLRNQNIEEYNIWFIAEEKRKRELRETLEKERLGISTEDITIPTTEPTIILHNPEESEFIDEIPEGYHKMPDGTIMKGSEHKTEREKLVEKTSVAILVLGGIGLYLALRFKS